ncbi:MAG: adenosine deaminase [Anaerolinea sp. 4484_236]|nr:MAG: adenosine deaminase [Anaerolinea sp. 4484_236]
MKEFITNLPKAELHLHIEGTLSPQTILKLADRNNIDIPYRSVKDIENALANRPAGLKGFLDHHYLTVSLIQTQEDFYEITYELLRDCQENNIVYVELFFDPQFHTERDIPFEAVINGIDQGRRDGAKAFGVEANLIMCINRERSVESAFEMLAQARPYRDKIIGLGMDSYEENNPPHKFTEVYAQAKKDGYRFTAHCDVDQTNSVQHIWECLDILNVERIDHGINSIDDPLLVEELKQRNIALTACPVRRRADPGPQDVDRIKKMYELGLLVTLNTDDPAEFDTGYLTNMLIEVQEASGYSKSDMVRFMMNAFEGSWLSRSAKDVYIESLLKYAATHGVPYHRE